MLPVVTSLLIATFSSASLPISQPTGIITALSVYSSLHSSVAGVVNSDESIFSILWCGTTTAPVPFANCICLMPLSSSTAFAVISRRSEALRKLGLGELCSALGVLTRYCAVARFSKYCYGATFLTAKATAVVGIPNPTSPTRSTVAEAYFSENALLTVLNLALHLLS